MNKIRERDLSPKEVSPAPLYDKEMKKVLNYRATFSIIFAMISTFSSMLMRPELRQRSCR